MTDGLTLTEDGAAVLSRTDERELVAKIRAIVHDVENLYRPTRALMPSSKVNTDPVMLGLYGARDALIAAEGSILGIALQPAGSTGRRTTSDGSSG